VILNIAESSTKDALQQAALAKQWNADGLMLLPPMRYKADDKETVEYFKTIARSTIFR
jgi:4-hydroxy-tetrahydrodipicolinate synthase